MRADCIGGTNDDCLIYAETNLEKILATAIDTQPQIPVIDSIQTIQTELSSDSSLGAFLQIRECATALLKYCKTEGVAVILIGHINKEGEHRRAEDPILWTSSYSSTVTSTICTASCAGRRTASGAPPSWASTRCASRACAPWRIPRASETQSDLKLSGTASREGRRACAPSSRHTALVSSAVYATPQRSIRLTRDV